MHQSGYVVPNDLRMRGSLLTSSKFITTIHWKQFQLPNGTTKKPFHIAYTLAALDDDDLYEVKQWTAYPSISKPRR